MALTVYLLVASFSSVYGFEGLVLGISNENDIFELVEADYTCTGRNITPPIPPPQFVPQTNPRFVSEYVDNATYLCGVENLDHRRDCYFYHPEKDTEWKYACKMMEDRRAPASLVFKDEMYLFGGYDETSGWSDTVEYKPSGQTYFKLRKDWNMLRPMHSHCAVAHGDKIYVMGGSIQAFLQNTDINNTDVLDTTTGKWSSTDNLPRNRSAASCTIYELNGEMGILLAGGCDNSCHEYLNDTIFYSFSKSKWKTLPGQLNIPRMGTRMVVINGKPTLIGGSNSDLIPEIEEFDGVSWKIRGKLSIGSFNYLMPSTLPDDIFNCHK